LEQRLDLNEYLIQHPAATFFVRVDGDSMVGAGIQQGDILIVDRSLEPVSGQIVIAVIDGAFTVKRIRFAAEGFEPTWKSKPSQVSPKFTTSWHDLLKVR
jgi:DNA polymerase V